MGGARRRRPEGGPGRVPGAVLVLAVLLGAIAPRPARPASDPGDPTPPSPAEARRLLDAGRYAAAESLARIVVEAPRSAVAESDRRAALLCLVDAMRLGSRPSRDDALRRARDAVALARGDSPPDTAFLAAALTSLGKTLAGAADYAEARAPLEETLALRARRRGNDPAAYAIALADLAAVDQATGRSSRADSLFTVSLLAFSPDGSPDPVAYARILGGKADAARSRGRLDEALDLDRRGLAVRDSVLGPDHPETSNSLNAIGNVLLALGRFDEARSAYERALAIRERTLGPDHPDVASTLNNLGVAYRRQERNTEALPLVRRAAAIAERSLGPRHPVTAQYLNNVAGTLYTLGAAQEAVPYAERALRFRIAILGPDHPDVGQSWLSVGLLRGAAGDRPGAREAFEKARRIYAARYGPDHPMVVRCDMEIGGILQDSGDYRAALPLLQRVVDIDGKTLGLDHPDYAQALATLAWLDRDMGDLRSSRALYDRALPIRVAAYGADHPLVAQNWFDLGLLDAMTGEADSAMARSLRAETLGRERLRLEARALPERLALDYAAQRPAGLDLALTLLERNPGADPALVWDALVRSRGVVLDALASRRPAIHGARASGPRAAYLELLGRYAGAAVDGAGDDESPAAYAARLRALRDSLDRAEETLAAAGGRFAVETARSRAGIREVLASLPPGASLVAYVRYRRWDWTRHADPSHYVTVPCYGAFTARSGDPTVAFTPLGEAAAIDSAVADWRREAASPPPRGGEFELEARARRTGERLRGLVWDPVAAWVGGGSPVFLVPDGDLLLVPFAALPGGGGTYLVESGPLLAVLTAERDLVGTPDETPGHGLLLVGDPDFDADVAAPADAAEARGNGERSGTFPCDDLLRAGFPPLPGTTEEVKAVLGLWRGRRVDDPADTLAVALTGAAADEEAVKRDAPGKRILHLATHGFFLAEPCAAAGTRARGIGGVTVEAKAGPEGKAPPAEAPQRPENPLLLSGLALAGANRRGEARNGEDDGLLTAQEVASLDLGGVEWAVLSACGTGLGRLRSGEGVLGLRRALEIAGVRTTWTSLWGVDDRDARRFMERLYAARFERGASTAAAGREAQIELLSRLRANGESTRPFHWAAFVASGDWR